MDNEVWESATLSTKRQLTVCQGDLWVQSHGTGNCQGGHLSALSAGEVMFGRGGSKEHEESRESLTM